jgi:hypothetical protein
MVVKGERMSKITGRNRMLNNDWYYSKCGGKNGFIK